MIINQVALNLSIITACIPSLRRIVIELTTHQTGLRVSENLELAIGSSGYHRRKTERASKSSNSKTMASSGGSRRSNPIPYGHNVDSRVGTTASIYSPRNRGKIPGREASEEDLTDENIHCTVEVCIEEEEDDHVSTEDARMERWT